MREHFKLPDVGEGLTEAEIVTWRVAPGDTVAVNDVIVEIETAKAAVELPSPWAGTVGELLVEPGATVAVGTPIIAIDTAGSAHDSDPDADAGAKIGEAGKDGRLATLVGYGPRQGSARRRPRRDPAASAASTGSAAPVAPTASAEPSAGSVAANGSVGADSGGSGRPGGSGPGGSGSGASPVPSPQQSLGSPEQAAPVTSTGLPEGSDTGAGGDAVGPQAAQVPLAPPPVRLLARELGVDLRTVTGTGRDDRITREDVHAAATGAGLTDAGNDAAVDGRAAGTSAAGTSDVGASEDGAFAAGTSAAGASVAGGPVAAGAAGGVTGAAVAGAAAPGAAGRTAAGQTAAAQGGVAGQGAGESAGAPAGPGASATTTRPTEDRREPIRGVRKATAAAMVASAFTAPHVTEFLDVDVTETMALRDRLRASREFAGVKLTPLAFVAKAACLAAARTPAINASWDERAGEIVYYARVQLGIAAATPRGLVVPKIRDADTLTLRGMADALTTLTDTARAGRTAPADLVGGTFTITNVGVLGVDIGTPIINPGEAAILAVGSIKPAPWVVDGELVVRTVCRLALSFDHRLVDGAEGSRFLADVGALLHDPGVALTW
ncbi:Dihydrolipoamide acetyltransferase component of pyruvate dehydrogenase complex [Pseudonocardia sp. Ae406_Ps2]|uniref:dihydrolipoamide acetyltransferase family protein n=1 Tax=unclassified Pseudonocardia TaxID=2619320 RepID=UPI00094B77D1|nr:MULTISPECIES: dihydrolipoamide acetyltransferase family protein [unclassified Pseudonocardia]OLL98379.1 Dihydrolipoamide acetyltransferase component of pyruvate dehydrogenase complex [Pseudonocardia sp. Ae331_Ps2]OLM03902.1 Dihydrolipoamide acetyltransferase component of pyruvate dehydrogenase complex [Pseudonocardia sp. Ae406_Ps2]OLM25457.1 Dihydrolipoamide acetyltransferase component of pyruvate dehydrogenase complex [Pseudonocardia sp. Ae706_Ps2]